MRIAHSLALFSALTCLVGCGGDIQTVEVNSFRVPCTGFINQMCFLTQAEGETEATLSYSPIYGFDYQWGYEYELITERHHISNPPQDASSVRVELVEIVKAEPVAIGTEFHMTITPQQYAYGYAPHVQRVAEDDDSRWVTLDEEPFTCASDDVCSALADALEGEANAQLVFTFEQDLALVLQEVNIS